MRRAAAAIAACVLGACSRQTSADDGQQYAHLMAFDSTTMRIVAGTDTLHLRIELARSREQHTMGLMERRHLDGDAGMLFVFDSTQDANDGFWMYRTRIPLDIAFLDSIGIVRSMREMAPCTAELIQGCPSYAPGTPYRYALEVNGGYLARHHVSVGSVAVLPSISAASKPER
jgi:hypothetical protein